MEQPTPQDAPAASSPAPVDSSTFLENLSSEDRKAFFEGSADKRASFAAKPVSETPSPSPAAPADSAPAEAVETAASTDAKTQVASETAAPAKHKGLKARSEQVDLEIADLKRKLEIRQELERQLSTRTPPNTDATPAESSTATEAKSWQKYRDLPDAPKLDQFETHEDYLDARAEFIATKRYDELREHERTTHLQQHQQRQYHEQVTAAETRITKYAETNPDFKDRVHPELLNLTPLSQLGPNDPVGPQHFVAEQIWRSENNAELLLHFSEHPEDFQALCEAGHPAQIMRRLGQIEAKVAKAETSVESRVPQPKTIPDADEMPVTLGKKAPVTGSDADSALREKDFSAYERAWKRDKGMKD